MLSVLVFLPILGAAVVMLLPRREGLLRSVAFVTFLLTFVLAAWLFWTFPPGEGGFRWVERAPWIPALGVSYQLGVDGISLLLVMLTAFLFPVAQLGTWDAVRHRVKEYLSLLLLLEGAVLGTFLALDLVLFYVFWEAVLIPMYFLIGLWGGERRRYAAVKFFLFTMAGSVLMLLGILVLYLRTGTFEVPRLLQTPLPTQDQRWLFWAFTVAFAIKVPMFPLHTWLPDAHVEAPTAGSVILAGLLLKMGAYGLVRYGLGLFPEAAREAAPLLSLLAVVGILYGGGVAFAQQDIKKLVAYSSISHLGFVVLGTFVFTLQGMHGALLQMVNHGLSTGGLFLLVGVLYERAHTRQMDAFGGIARVMPTFAALSLFIVFSSAALPGTNGFIGEFLVLLGTFRADVRLAALAAGGVILSAVYLLWMVQRVYFGPVRVDPGRFTPLTWKEAAALVALVLVILWIGLYPKPLLERSEAALSLLSSRLRAVGEVVR
ncbi:MAG: NADH-quinone oxidoreductase subunit M [Armatimonadetes bacterium]|nr:NADH-quinone oxidoreductase subunit M [Armatimonadota bacterium]MDW8153806.1 NADH-quinone oxidoreductase subunit M [Armatimonadota bacterium]